MYLWKKHCWIWAAVVVAMMQWAPAAEKSAPPATLPSNSSGSLKVLFIGNSYTYYNGGLGTLLQQMAKSVQDGRKIEFLEVTKGGQSLEGHWKDGRALTEIRKGGWDIVVLQEQSLRPLVDREKMLQYAKLFDAEIRKIGAKTMLFETWARKNRPETQGNLHVAFDTVAREIGAKVAPAGMAWQRLLGDKPQFPLHQPDQSHPTPAGSYLNACVFYATLVGHTPEGLPRTIRSASGKVLVDLNETDAAVLQRIAAEVSGQTTKAQ